MAIVLWYTKYQLVWFASFYRGNDNAGYLVRSGNRSGGEMGEGTEMFTEVVTFSINGGRFN